MNAMPSSLACIGIIMGGTQKKDFEKVGNIHVHLTRTNCSFESPECGMKMKHLENED